MGLLRESRGRGDRPRRLLWGRRALAGLLLGVWSSAEACVPPQRPYVPADPDAVRSYASILKGDFEGYFADIQQYFRCLDEERTRAFEEAREVGQDYGNLLEALGK